MKRVAGVRGWEMCWRGRAALSSAVVLLASGCVLPDRFPDEAGGAMAVGGNTGTGTGGARAGGMTGTTAGGSGASTVATGGVATGGVPAAGGLATTVATGGVATGGVSATGGIPSTGRAFVPIAAQAQSCKGLCDICQGESCCTSIHMPGGTYPMGRGTEDCGSAGCQTGTGNEGCPVGSSCSSFEQPEHSATVSTFALDKFEVTVGRFRNFVSNYDAWHRDQGNPKHGDGAHPSAASTGWGQSWTAAAHDLPTDADALVTSLKCDASFQTWTDSTGTDSAEAYPINCITWFEAFAFCIWDGGRLPTEAEWEYAAAGGEQNRLYPWGSAAPDHARANYDDSTPAGPVFTVVGSKLATGGGGYFGHADLAGSMVEWAFDWYHPHYYGTTGDPIACNDCADTTILTHRVLRGGTVNDYDHRAAYRGIGTTMLPRSLQGFRCARTP